MQPAGNHEVQHKPEIAFNANADAFAKPTKLNHLFTLQTLERRNCGTKQRGRSDLHTCERLPEDSLLEGLYVDDNVRKFRHLRNTLLRGSEDYNRPRDTYSCDK